MSEARDRVGQETAAEGDEAVELRAHHETVSEARDRVGQDVPAPAPAPTASVETVEAVVRAQLSKALGGRRGMVIIGSALGVLLLLGSVTGIVE